VASRIALTVSKSAVFLFVLACAQLSLADISGQWHFDLNVQGQTGSAEVSIEHTSDTDIKGTYVGQRFGTVEFVGTIIEGRIDFELALSAGQIVYEGQLQEDGSIKGTADLAGMATANFVAEKE